MKKLLLMTAAALSVASAARADLTPILNVITDLGNGTSQWDYDFVLTPDSGVYTNSRVVIYDFDGYVPGSISAPSGIADSDITILASVEMTTSTDLSQHGLPANPEFVDDPNIPNLVFQFVGAPGFQTENGPYPILTLHGFSAASTDGYIWFNGFTSRSEHNTGLLTGLDEFNNGAVLTPVACLPNSVCTGDGGGGGGGPISCVPGVVCLPPPGVSPCLADQPCDVHGGVPEPASWALMIVGFGGAGALLRRARRSPALAA